MSLDRFGNYTPDLSHPVPPASDLSGTASPEGVITGSPGKTFWNTTTKKLYVKDTGTGNTGWVAVN